LLRHKQDRKPCCAGELSKFASQKALAEKGGKVVTRVQIAAGASFERGRPAFIFG